MAKFLDYAPTDAGLQRADYIPTNMASQGLLSETSHAYTCFTKQKFAADLQAFLVNYAISVTSFQSIYK
jgi:hypothetical protein